jgi:serine phosphatase RsbU (regulator of sigma subunit)
VQEKITNKQIAELATDDSEVLTTVMDFGAAEIKRSTRADLSLLIVSGTYSQKLAKEIERASIQCRGNIGLEFRDMQVNPAFKRKFDISILRTLDTIRSRALRRKCLFLLCNPPSELVDILKLAGVYHTFQIVTDAEALPTAGSIEMDPAAVASDTVADPLRQARRRIVHLNQSLKRTVSLEKGLDSAEKCVLRFLPQNAPASDDYDFAFSYSPSDKVGGDFFDFLRLDEEHIGITIGDVSGHGIDAALLMAISKKVVHIRARDAGPGASPRKVLEKANRDLVDDFSRSTFVTVLYAILHEPTGAFTYARAAHEPPYVCGPRKGQVRVHDSKGIPLGVDSGKLFDRVLEERTVQISSGGFVFLCTDGLGECWNPRDTQFSKKRLIFSLEHLDQDTPCEDALASILKSVNDFAEGRPPEDDMTTILIKRKPPETDK